MLAIRKFDYSEVLENYLLDTVHNYVFDLVMPGDVVFRFAVVVVIAFAADFVVYVDDYELGNNSYLLNDICVCIIDEIVLSNH